MSERCVYTVTAEFDDEHVLDEWLAWLRDGHLADVRAAGALDSEVIRWEGAERCCSVHYHFADRDAFAAYERDHAPRLREGGIQLFPPSRGIRYRRGVGVVVG